VKVRRLGVDDRVDRDGEAVVLVGDHVVRLSALATALLDAATDWVDEEELAAVLVAGFGDPPDGAGAGELTRRAVDDLAAQGLVERG
jgi:hypothetical protein